jgi:hypothetical protein
MRDDDFSVAPCPTRGQFSVEIAKSRGKFHTLLLRLQNQG